LPAEEYCTVRANDGSPENLTKPSHGTCTKTLKVDLDSVSSMRTPKLSFFLLATALLASSFIFIQSASSQSTLSPPVKEFTLQLADHSYSVPPEPTSTKDPYTSQVTNSTIPGYRVENITIDATSPIHREPHTTIFVGKAATTITGSMHRTVSQAATGWSPTLTLCPSKPPIPLQQHCRFTSSTPKILPPEAQSTFKCRRFTVTSVLSHTYM
jgi:hypothetical protein